MAFHFPIMPRLFMALRMEDSYPISDILEQTPAIPSSCQWALFLRNHDELTLEMVTDEERDYMVERYAADRRTRINLGIRRRLAPLLENDRRRIELMNRLLLSLPGTPVLYYGDEIGMGDNPYLGDRDGVRTPMQWSPDRNGGFSRANPQRLILPTILDPEYSFETVNVEVQESNPSSLLWWTKRMIALRKQHQAFGRGALQMLAPENRKVLAFLRRHEEQVVLVVANLSRFPQWVELELAEFAGVVPVELVGNGAFPAIDSSPYRLTLGGHDGLWLSLSRPLERQRSTSLLPPLPAASPLSYDGEWQELFSPGSPLEQVLVTHVPAQRWFRSKARAVERARLLDVVGLPSSDTRAKLHLAFVQIVFVEGEAETYVLPLRIVQSELRPDAALLRLGQAEASWLCDASLLPETATALQAIAFEEQQLVGKSITLRGKRHGGAVVLLDTAKPLGTEQSNTSFVFGQQQVGKLVRKLEPGGSLEVDILSALQAGSRKANVPSFLARVDAEAAGESATLWMSESFVSNEGDAWQLTIDLAQRFYEQVLAEQRGAPPPELASDLFQPGPAGGALLDFLPLAQLLGRRTAELHAALFASFSEGPAAPKPFTALSSRGYYQSVRNLSARALDALKHAHLSEAARDMASALFERRALLRRIIDAALQRPLLGQRMRVHGDYHLGQVLYTGSDFFIIDFEGEPGRSPNERRRLRSPMADVASMVRSLHYAAFGVVSMQLPGAQTRPEDRAELEPWARHFYGLAARAFLDSYLAAATPSGFLPAEQVDMRTSFELHLVEKALYELLYELNNRPNWVELPLRGLLDLVRLS
ncbi:MAG TPA: alpha-glucosidase C-terminal domain-containing protein, partial [Polyangiaceae bacterium]